MTRLISIEGNIGSGKSTFVEDLHLYYKNPENCAGQKICFLQEPVDVWNTITDEYGNTVIQCFYADNQKYAFAFQMMAYISRLSNIKRALNEDYDIIFMERCLNTDRNVFAQMLYDDTKISEIEYKIYNKWFDEFLADFPNIEYIYLKTDPVIASTRIIKRARLGETIPLEYLIKCNEYHEKWLDQMEPKFILDCNVDNNEDTNIMAQWIDDVARWVRGNPYNPNYVLDLANMSANIGANMAANIGANMDANMSANMDAYLATIISSSTDNEYTLTFDGASRGNPGMCGAGYVIWKDGEVFMEGNKYICDYATNNYAEYYALIIGLQRCVELNIKRINVKGDSLLVIKQITKEFKINAENLLPLYMTVMNLLENIIPISCINIPIAENKRADKLANQAIDDYIKSTLSTNGVGVWQRA